MSDGENYLHEEKLKSKSDHAKDASCLTPYKHIK